MKVYYNSESKLNINKITLIGKYTSQFLKNKFVKVGTKIP